MDQPLEKVQRWMQAVITHPAGIAAGLAADEAQSELPLAANQLDQVVEPSQRLTSAERLAVYSNAYYARLIECLEAEFPVFRYAVGEEEFAGFTLDYLQRYPSRSYTLGNLGVRFADYLAETKPPPGANSTLPNWADFLIELAQIERIFSEVFDGPGVEDQPPLSADQFLSLAPDLWSESQLKPVPCLRLLSLQFPLNDYYTAVKRGENPVVPAAKPSWLAVTRRDYIVRRYNLTEPQFLLLGALGAGQTIGAAVAGAAAAYEGNLESLAAELGNWFRTWAAAPMFDLVTSAAT